LGEDQVNQFFDEISSKRLRLETMDRWFGRIARQQCFQSSLLMVYLGKRELRKICGCTISSRRLRLFLKLMSQL